MKVFNSKAVTKVKQLGRRLCGRCKPLPDTVQFSSANRVINAKNKRESIDYAKLYINGTDAVQGIRCQVLDNICAFIMGMGANVKRLRVVKNSDGKIVGGYMSNMRSKEEFHIASMAVEKPGSASKILPAIYKDMVNQIKKTDAKYVTCLVDPRSESLVKLYKKIGFQVDGLADPLEFGFNHSKVLYHMYMPAKDFCKIM